MKVWINGAEGFIGSHLISYFNTKKINVIGTSSKESENLLKCDIKSPLDIENVLKLHKPEIIFHLAAQSYVDVSWKYPDKTLITNIIGTKNVFEGIRKSGQDPLVLVAGSSAEYGDVDKDKIPIKETQILNPITPYGISKVGEEMVANLYFKVYGIKTIKLRFFNITGPGKTNDATSDFARRVVDIENKKEKYLEVGNVNKVRDITDVRDLVEALIILINKGKCGDVYNVCSGKGRKIQDILDFYKRKSQKKIKIKQKNNLVRIYDEDIYVGDNTKLNGLGWEPKITFEKTLEDTLFYWRNNFNNKII